MFKILLLYSVIVIASSAAHHPYSYRKDYKYSLEFNAFYKLHFDNDGDGVSWNTAFMTCDEEGAQLFYPEKEEEWDFVYNLTAELPEALQKGNVIVGFHDEAGQGEFSTVDGEVTPNPVIDRPIPKGHYCIIRDMETETYKAESCDADPLVRRLFVCKKIDEKPCPTIDIGYIYVKETKKCYKVNSGRRSWQKAWYTCFMEGGLLVSPQSEEEARLIHSLIPNKDNKDNYFSGFRRLFPGSNFYTVKGKKINESGFQRWYSEEDKSKYDCGALYVKDRELYMATEKCDNLLPFICEMRAKD